MADSTSIPVIVQGNSFSLAIPLQIYYINGDQMDLQDYTPDPTDEVSVQLKGSRRNYTYTPTIDGNVANIDLSGNELADNYGVVVSVVKANGQRLRSFRTDQFFIVESSDDLTTDDIIQGLEENVIYLNAQAFIAGADGRGIEGIQKTSTSGLVDTYTITYTDNTTSTFQVTNGANGQAGAQGQDGVGITSIEKTATVGLVDTYTITLSNGQTSTFEVTNGRDGVDLGLATIVDNLTEGGSTNVLSAEQGKVLNERLEPVEQTLDVTSSLEVITKTLTPSEIGDNKGYLLYNKINTATSSAELRRYSNPIHLKTGDVLYIKAATPNNVYLLAKYVEGATNNALKILQGASSSWSDIIETTYTATEEFDALVGWYWQSDIEIKITRQEDVSTSKLDDMESDVNGMVNVLVYSNTSTTENEPITLTENTGYYQNSSGRPATIATGAGYRYSNFFNAKAGDILNIDVENVATSVGVLMRNEASGVRIITKGTNNTQHITFTVPYDAQYAVGWLASTGITITKVVTTVGSSERLDDIEADTALIAPLSQDVANLNDANFEVVNDDLTTGIVTGKYIGHDGSFGTNDSFAYKEISVKAGAVINYTASVHPNLAAIAEKIPSTTKYKELVPATQQAVQSFTYTATKDMTIAVSFSNGSSSTHTITISTTMPTSNRKNIENIFGTLNVKHYVDYGLMFDKIAVLGDSLASGRVEGIVGQPDAAGADYYNFSWLAFLAKRWRCASFKNYSGSAGATTASWLQDWLPVMQADTTVYDAYFIALGTNNEYNESSPSGANYEAFVQRFNDIIDAVRAKAPHAVIFIMSLYEIRAGNATLENIAQTRMATDDGVFYIDYANQAEYFRYSPEVNWRGHFSSTGYVYVAEAINRIVNDVVWDNQQEEFWQQFAKYHNGD